MVCARAGVCVCVFQDEAALVNLEAFEQLCLDVDGLALVEYAIAMQQSGCILDLSGDGTGGGGGGGGGHRRLRHRRRRRQLQVFLAQRLSSSDAGCSWDEMDDYAADVDTYALYCTPTTLRTLSRSCRAVISLCRLETNVSGSFCRAHQNLLRSRWSAVPDRRRWHSAGARRLLAGVCGRVSLLHDQLRCCAECYRGRGRRIVQRASRKLRATMC
jgi:hypothetical protein